MLRQLFDALDLQSRNSAWSSCAGQSALPAEGSLQAGTFLQQFPAAGRRDGPGHSQEGTGNEGTFVAMPRRPATFTQADVDRALRAIAQSGMKAEVVLETDGTIRIVLKEEVRKPLTPAAPIRL